MLYKLIFLILCLVYRSFISKVFLLLYIVNKIQLYYFRRNEIYAEKVYEDEDITIPNQKIELDTHIDDIYYILIIKKNQFVAYHYYINRVILNKYIVLGLLLDSYIPCYHRNYKKLDDILISNYYLILGRMNKLLISCLVKID